MTTFASKDNQTVMSLLSKNYLLLTGQEPFVAKSKAPNKKDEAVIPVQEFTLVNACVFMEAFREASARGLMNAVEQKQAQVVYDLLMEVKNG